VATFRDMLEEELNRVEDLPVFPPVLGRLTQALASEKTGAEDVAQILAQDPALTARLLRVANSVYYAATTAGVSSVTHAVARLGFREISRLFTALTVIRTFDQMGRHLDHDQFWKHSLTAGITTRVIKRYCGAADPFSEDDAYVAGLLHDIGVLVLDQHFPALYVEVNAVARRECISRADAERLVLGIDHGEIAGQLFRRWRIPSPVAQAVTWHHQPGQAEPGCRTLVAVVHLADSICGGLGVGDAGSGACSGFSDVAWHVLGLSVDDLPAIIREVAEEAARSETLVALAK